MIKNVTGIYAKVHDYVEDVWLPVYFVPATATLDITTENDEAGRSSLVTLNAVVPHRAPILDENLTVKVIYDNGLTRVFGTEDFPVRFTIEEADVIRISAEYRVPMV